MSPDGKPYRTNRGYYIGHRVRTIYGTGYIRQILNHDPANDRTKIVVRLTFHRIHEVEVWDTDVESTG